MTLSVRLSIMLAMAIVASFANIGIGWSQNQPGDPPGKWKKIKADNGAWAAIDMTSIVPWSTGGAFAIVCISDDGGPCPFLKMGRILFDCHGHYTDIDHGGLLLPAPPLSLGGQLASIACTDADLRRKH